MKTILVVDDDADEAELLAQALAGPARRVRAFADPLRALAALTHEGADVLIADVAMPWIDGRDVVAGARLRAPGLAIFLVSGVPGGEELAARAGVPFFPKPVDLTRLRRAVERALGESRAVAEPV